MPVLCTFGSASIHASPAPPAGYLTTGLLLNLDATTSSSFNGTSSSTWVDLAGNTNASFVSAATKSSDGGGSVIFNGSNYATFPSAITAGKSEISIELWVKLNGSPASNAALYSEEQGSYWEDTIEMTGWYTRTAATGATGARTDDLTLSAIPANSWAHLCFVYSVSGGFKRFYLNSILQNSVSGITSALISGAATGFRLGGASDGTEYNGLMRQVRIYNVALTQAQITSNYNGTFTA